MENYEKLLAECQGKGNLKNLSGEDKKRVYEQEAICIANIIKISHCFLGKNNYNYLCELGDRCETIATEKIKIDENVEWYKDFKGIYEDIQKLNQVMKSINQTKEDIKAANQNVFDEIDRIFNTKDKNSFIEYILTTTPYDGYENDISEKKNIFKKGKEVELINYLRSQYHPYRYEFTENPKEQLRYCKIEYIDAKLNKLYDNINL